MHNPGPMFPPGVPKRSINAVLEPILADAIAAKTPDTPAPATATSTSYSTGTFLFSSTTVSSYSPSSRGMINGYLDIPVKMVTGAII
jgi:hypothetical protein